MNIMKAKEKAMIQVAYNLNRSFEYKELINNTENIVLL